MIDFSRQYNSLKEQKLVAEEHRKKAIWQMLFSFAFIVFGIVIFAVGVKTSVDGDLSIQIAGGFLSIIAAIIFGVSLINLCDFSTDIAMIEEYMRALNGGIEIHEHSQRK